MDLTTWNTRFPVETTMCGACKATGLLHIWNAQADLVPAEPKQPCSTCGGTGWFPKLANRT